MRSSSSTANASPNLERHGIVNTWDQRRNAHSNSIVQSAAGRPQSAAGRPVYKVQRSGRRTDPSADRRELDLDQLSTTDQRVAPRYVVNWRVAMVSSGCEPSIIQGRVVNISITGMSFVSDRKPPAPMAVAYMALPVMDRWNRQAHGPVLEISSQVVYTVSMEETGQFRSGLRFVDLCDDARVLIEGALAGRITLSEVKG
jgi:PilZ domain